MPTPTRLKIAIVASGLTAREVAQRIGKDEATLSRWANDARPVPADVREQLARLLDTTVDDLWPYEPQAAAA